MSVSVGSNRAGCAVDAIGDGSVGIVTRVRVRVGQRQSVSVGGEHGGLNGSLEASSADACHACFAAALCVWFWSHLAGEIEVRVRDLWGLEWGWMWVCGDCGSVGGTSGIVCGVIVIVVGVVVDWIMVDRRRRRK